MPYDTNTPTRAMYETLQQAFDYFNRELFNNELPQCMLVLHRKRGTRGYFWSGMWRQRADMQRAALDEISLAPEELERAPIEILGTLVHEMAHLWQQHFGKPSRSGYHNKQWAEKMKEIGLQPIAVGPNVKDGAETGQKCTHSIIEADRFDVAAKKFLEAATLDWYGVRVQPKAASNKNKTKYECSCGNNIWGKAGLRVVCEDCEETYTEV